jgi:predicted regulator of Ras-like GTPase activity (Roadblock/LC7/MglB family)
MEDQSLNALRRLVGVNSAFIVDRTAPASGDASVATAQSALIGAVVAALTQAAGDLDLGQLGETIIEAERGSVVAGALPNGRAAVVLADSKANLGMIRMELRKLRRQS